MSGSAPHPTWQEKLAEMARRRGIECREMLPSDRPACCQIAKQSFPENLSDLLTGTCGFVLVNQGAPIGYIIIDEWNHTGDFEGGRKIVGEVTDAAVLSTYRHWAGLLFLRAAKYLAARGGIWVADCLPATIYRFMRGAERRGFIKILEENPVVFRGCPMRRLYFVVGSAVSDVSGDPGASRAVDGPPP